MGKDEEKKGGPITSWLLGYYGDDAIDLSKKTKIKHLLRTGEFASMIYLISKNSKKAHTDFFEEKYDTLDVMYAKAAAIIVKLLKIKYSEGRPLTPKDFDDCGGAEMFASRQNYAEICEDYIGPGGLVEMCDISCVPRPEVEHLLEGKETKKDYKNLPQDEKERRIIKKMAVLYGGFVEDLDEVRGHHSELLKVVGSDNGTLKLPEIIEIFKATKDKGDEMFKKEKGKISALDFDIKDDYEKSFEIHYDTIKKTGKLALLGSVALTSLGAVAGGVFWPAFVLIPVYGLAKQWLPDWAQSLGKEWGHLEKTMGHKFESRKYKAHHRYMVSFLETNGHPKIRLLDRPFLTKAVRKCLDKGCKSGLDTVSFEGSDGEFHRSAVDSHITHTSENLATYINGGDLIPADSVPWLNSEINKITPENATFEKFEQLTELITKSQNLTTDEKYKMKKAFAKKLKECSIKLIFETEMETMTQTTDFVAPFFKDESPTMKLISEIVSDDSVAMIKRYVNFAQKELSGLQGSELDDDGNLQAKWRGKTLKDFIYRTELTRVENQELSGLVLDQNSGAFSGDMSMFHNFAGDANLQNAVRSIMTLKVSSENEKVVTDDEGHTLKQINEMIGKIADATDDSASHYVSNKTKCLKLLEKQMSRIFYNASREDSKLSFEALIRGDFNGKVAFDEVFKKISEMTYDNIDDNKFIELNRNITRSTSINPPAMGRYLRGKLGKAAFDVFEDYASKHRSVFRSNLIELTKYLQKLNDSSLLTEEQKSKLTANISGYLMEAVDNYTQKVSLNFMSEDSKDGYDHGAITQYLTQNYVNYGFKQLFDSDKSPAVTAVKSMFESMGFMNNAHKALKFNGLYSLSKTDSKIIGSILLRDANDNLETFNIRESDDKLIDFLQNKLIFDSSCSYPKFSTVREDPANGITINAAIKNTIQAQGSPYDMLRDRLDYIKSNKIGDDTIGFFDKYAALVALKNKTIVEVRKSLNKIIEDRRSGLTPEEWLAITANSEFYKAAVDAWNDLFGLIDRAIEESKTNKEQSYNGDPEGLKKFLATFSSIGDTQRLSAEKERYNTGQLKYNLTATGQTLGA